MRDVISALTVGFIFTAAIAILIGIVALAGSIHPFLGGAAGIFIVVSVTVYLLNV